MLYPIAILLLTALSACFSAAETAFSAVNRIRLKHDAMNGDCRAERALALADAFDRALTAILIGNNLVNILSASLGTILFTKWFGDAGVGISTAAMTLLVLIFGEILPKSYAKYHAESLVRFFATPLNVLIWLLRPFIFLFHQLSNVVAIPDSEPTVTEDELKVIVDQIEEEGVLEEQESELVRSALEFDEIPVSEILVPRVSVTAVQKDMPIAEVKAVFLAERYSRVPVYEESLDDIIGFITEKDFFGLLEAGGTSLHPIIQGILRLPEFARISDALKQMQRVKSHIAVVVDQYGGTAGIVTLEDIIEELVGEIYDEADEVKPMVVKLDERRYELSGELPISELEETLDMAMDTIETECTSVGGWFTELAGHIPEAGEVQQTPWCTMTVLTMEEQRVCQILLELVPSENINEST